jgi:hypothetical protein
MELENLVISPSTALALKAAGVNVSSCFGYYQSNGKARLKQTTGRSGSFMAYAYTAAELLEILPGGLEVDKNTYVATLRNWVHLRGKELNYPLAHLYAMKTPGASFLTGYYHHNRMIGFTRYEDGKVANLLCDGDSLAESLAGMILDLIRERKLPVLNEKRLTGSNTW